MKRVKNAFVIIVILFIIVAGGGYKIFYRSLSNYFLRSNTVIIKAVIIGNKNFSGNDKVKPEFTYSYSFTIAGKTYINDSHDQNLRIGDSIDVMYNKDYPFFNKAVHPKD